MSRGPCPPSTRPGSATAICISSSPSPPGSRPRPGSSGRTRRSGCWRATDAERYEDVDTAAPYPGLVSLGTMDDSRLLLNLESVPGIVSLSGREADRAAVFASVAAELATNGWSDRMTITLVGFGEDLTPLAPNRLRHLGGHRRPHRDHGGRDAAAARRAGRRRARLRPHRAYGARPAHPLGAAPRPARRRALRRGRRQARRTRLRREPAGHRLPRRHRVRRSARRRLGDGGHQRGQAPRPAARPRTRRPAAARWPSSAPSSSCSSTPTPRATIPEGPSGAPRRSSSTSASRGGPRSTRASSARTRSSASTRRTASAAR